MLTRRTFLVASAAAIAALAAGCSTTSVLAPSAGTGSDQTAASLGLVNKLRAERGLSALVIDKQAQRAAMDQASRMASAGKMEHNIGFGANFLKRMKGMEVPLPYGPLACFSSKRFYCWVISMPINSHNA